MSDELDTSSAVANYLQSRQPEEAVRTSMTLAAGANPDAEAEYKRLAREAGIPIDSVRDNKDAVKQQVSAPNYGELATKFPGTTKYLSTLENARIAHDDVGNLTGIEKAIRGFIDPQRQRAARPAPSVMRSEEFGLEVRKLVANNPSLDFDTARRLLMDGRVIDNQSQLMGASRGPAPSLSSIISGLFNPDRARAVSQGAGVAAADFLGFDAAPAIRRYEIARARAAGRDPEFETATGRGLYSGLVSTVDNAPGIALSIATMNPLPGLLMAGGQVSAESYGKYRARGATAGEAATGALAEGAVEVATEALPMGFLVEKLGRAGAGTFLKGLLARELPSEQVATLAQDAIDTAIANPDKTWAQYVAERPGAAYQTLLATLVQSGTMGAVNTVANRITGFDAQAQRAEESATRAQEFAGLIEQSKLRERDPEAFKQFVAEVAESGETPTEFYIDAQQLANSLNQSAVTIEQLRAFAPAVADQMEAARQVPGADIRVPVAEFAAAPSNITTTLIDHLRETPQAMSRAEAQAFLKEAGPRIQGEVESALTTETLKAETTQAIDKLRNEFQTQLDAVGKFRPEVNKAYATMLGNFYGTQAERAGLTVEEFADRYGLRVAGKDVAGRQRLEQGDFEGNAARRSEAIGAGLPLVKAQKVVQELTAGWTNGPRVNVVQTHRELPVDMPPDVRGLYTPGNVWIVAGAHADSMKVRETIGRTLAHEAIAHYGLREMLGREGWGELMGNIQKGIAAGNKELLEIQAYIRRAYKSFDLNPNLEADEIAARVVEQAVNEKGEFKPGLEFVKAVYARIAAFLRELGIDLTFTTAELHGMLVLAQRGLEDGKRAEGGGQVMVAAARDENTLNQGERGALNFGDDITASPSVIALLEGADLSTFIHESGHFFLEVQADLASRIQRSAFMLDEMSDGERQIVADMERILNWFGVKGDGDRSALDAWAMMTLEEKREHHETWARGFERYVMEGKAPSQELQALFSKFRAWLVSVYKTLKGLNVDLTDDVRQVMDRMLASDSAISETKAADAMGPLFESPEHAGMTPAEFASYQALGERATATADAELDARLLKDMKWLSRARNKAIKAAQEQAADVRHEIEREVRFEVMAQPVYQAWQFLTGKIDRVEGLPREKPVGEEVDNLFVAIAKLGGLNAAGVKSQWGFDAKNDDMKSGLFGKPVLRKNGGVAIDMMAERLVEAGYLIPDEHGKADIAKFEELFDAQRRGIDHFSIRKQYAEEGDVKGLDLPATASGRLNTDELKRMYGEELTAKWRLLSERRMTSPSGLDPEVVAASFGFDSGDEMVQALVDAPPPATVIAELTDQQMLQRFGDITSKQALERAADEAVHNELRARVVATELQALEKAGSVRAGPRSTVAVMARAAKDYAYQVIARQRVRDLRPSQYSAAQARSAKLAQQALGKSLEEAAMHKRNELINTYATRAAFDAQAEVKAAQAYFAKFSKRIKGIDAEYQDQIDQMLERFDFKSATLKAIDKRKSFAEWYAQQEAAGNAPNVPDDLVENAGRKSFKDMTVEELRGLRDAIKQIEHQGRLKNRLLLSRDKREFDAVAQEMVDSIIAHGGEARPVQLEGPNPVTDWFAGLAASHRKLASLFRQMDGNKDRGLMYEQIGRAMNERSTMEDVMLEKATMALRDLYAPLLKMRGGITGYRSKVFIPEINASLTRGGRLAVALNWGNEANRQRIMDGDKWGDGQVRAILKTLTPTELEFVNGVWAYIDTYWEEIAAKEKRLTGVEPEKVEAIPFNVIAADGTAVAMRGGYYPLKYDTDRSDRADTQEAAQAAKEMMQGAITRATTRRGHTKERLKEVKRAVRKDLNVITQHVTQVVHDLAWHEWLIDTNKFLSDEGIVSAIRGHYGPKVLKSMRDDVLGIATADVTPQTDVDKALLLVRSNVTRATMGASLTTAFLQPFGLTQSIVRIGGRHVLRGVARWGGDAARMESTVGWIHDKSEFMRLRAKTFNRELREIRGAVAGKSKTMRVIDAGLFVMMQKMQMVADVPTWVGQYEKSLSQGLDDAAAVAMADRAVLESQGGGATKDLAEVQRKHPMLTQFYSYFSVTLNLAAEQTAATDFKNPAAVAGWLGDMALLLVVPAILPSLILFSLKGGDDDEEKGLVKRMAEWQVSYLMGLVVGLRELSGAVAGFDYAGPPVGRLIADTGKAGKQIAQGEVDEPAVLSLINLMGSAFGIPTTQALRSYKGWKAWDEGQEGAGPQSVLFGPPPKN